MSYHRIFNGIDLLHADSELLLLPEPPHEVRPCDDEGPVQLRQRLGAVELHTEA